MKVTIKFVILLCVMAIINSTDYGQSNLICPPSDIFPVDSATRLISDEGDNPDNPGVSSPLGGRIPLIIIHGIHGNADPYTRIDTITQPNRTYFLNFLNYFYHNNINLKQRYKIYRFHYESDRFRVMDIARSLRNQIERRMCIEPDFDTNFVILAHSMGGLVARSYMNQWNHNSGIYSGQLGGERVLNLITLATPHHGSPGTNSQSRDETATNLDWLVAMDLASFAFWKQDVNGLPISSIPFNQPNRIDLLWDNFDNVFRPSNPDINGWLQALNANEHYQSKIIAYYGFIKPDDNKRVNLVRQYNADGNFVRFDRLFPDAAAADLSLNENTLALISNIVLDYGMKRIYRLNDGLVPVESGSFKSTSLQKLVECPGYDHAEMRDGKKDLCSSNLNLLDSVMSDLGYIKTPYKITITTQATFNGQPWSGPVNYNILGFNGVRLNGSSVPMDFKNQPAGTYTLKYLSGGPPNTPAPTISPSETQSFAARGSLFFTMDFVTRRPPVWPMSGHDPQRRGQSPFMAPNLSGAPAPTWVYQTGGSITGDLAVSSEDVIYFASDKLYALNPNGTNFVIPQGLPGIPSGSPAVDDINGFVYFAFMLPDTTNQFVVIRYDKQLQNPTTVLQVVGGVGHLLVNNGTLYFMSGRYPATVHAVGAVNWHVSICPAENVGAPALGEDGSVYVTCWGNALYKLNGQTGATIRSYAVDRNEVEPMIDAQGNVFSGNQAYDGITYYGSYTKWDRDLNLVENFSGNYTNSRSSLMPDGTSTVRMGYAQFGLVYLSFRGATTWDVATDDRVNFTNVFTTPPSVDASGKIFVGKGRSVTCLRPTDGSTIWESPTTNQVSTQPVIARSGAVYVGTADGKIYAFPGN